VLNQINLNDYLPPAAEAQASDSGVPAEPGAAAEQTTSGDEKIELPVEMMRKMNINVVLDDNVEVEISTYDLTKCRITYRNK
jgi:hypothetical protein